MIIYIFQRYFLASGQCDDWPSDSEVAIMIKSRWGDINQIDTPDIHLLKTKRNAKPIVSAETCVFLLCIASDS